MKTKCVFHFCLLFFVGMTIVFSSCTGPDKNQLPSVARAFLNKHFENTEITLLEQNADNDYDVSLENGVEIEFERKGNWMEIKAKKDTFPQSFMETLPNQMIYYIQTNYPNQVIRKVARKAYGYEVKLSKPDNADLQFTRQGIFIKKE